MTSRSYDAMTPAEKEAFDKMLSDYRERHESDRRWWWKAPKYSLPDVTLRDGPKEERDEVL